ncbi:hypothetical protein GCM10027577_41000 [Spirosoma fluminis]
MLAVTLIVAVAVATAQVISLLTLATSVGVRVLLSTFVVTAAEQPLGVVTVTEYRPPTLTVIVGVVSPVLHRYVTPGVAVVLIVAVG